MHLARCPGAGRVGAPVFLGVGTSPGEPGSTPREAEEEVFWRSAEQVIDNKDELWTWLLAPQLTAPRGASQFCWRQSGFWDTLLQL